MRWMPHLIPQRSVGWCVWGCLVALLVAGGAAKVLPASISCPPQKVSHYCIHYLVLLLEILMSALSHHPVAGIAL